MIEVNFLKLVTEVTKLETGCTGTGCFLSAEL